MFAKPLALIIALASFSLAAAQVTPNQNTNLTHLTTPQPDLNLHPNQDPFPSNAGSGNLHPGTTLSNHDNLTPDTPASTPLRPQSSN